MPDIFAVAKGLFQLRFKYLYFLPFRTKSPVFYPTTNAVNPVTVGSLSCSGSEVDLGHCDGNMDKTSCDNNVVGIDCTGKIVFLFTHHTFDLALQSINSRATCCHAMNAFIDSKGCSKNKVWTSSTCTAVICLLTIWITKTTYCYTTITDRCRSDNSYQTGKDYWFTSTTFQLPVTVKSSFREQDKSSYVEQQQPLGDRKQSNTLCTRRSFRKAK